MIVATKDALNVKLQKLSIITDITNLATNATLNTKTKRIESKIRDTASFVKKEKNEFETFVLSYSRAKVVLMMMGCKII